MLVVIFTWDIIDHERIQKVSLVEEGVGGGKVQSFDNGFFQSSTNFTEDRERVPYKYF